MMTQFKQVILISLALLAISPLASSAEKQPLTFKKVMQELLIDSQKMTKGIIIKDFTLIEKSAQKIVNHAKPDLAIRLKIVKTLGSEMGKFKAKDTVVHNSALNLLNAAKSKDMVTITQEYQVLINGCLGCHTIYKEKVSKALN
jgi:cytochrome c556